MCAWAHVQVMKSPVVGFKAVTRVETVVNTLRSTKFNGFPVFPADRQGPAVTSSLFLVGVLVVVVVVVVVVADSTMLDTCRGATAKLLLLVTYVMGGVMCGKRQYDC